MFPVKPRENAIIVESAFEAKLFEEVLQDHQIPCTVISYEDSAFSGIYQTQNGWGHVEVPMEQLEEAKALYKNVHESKPLQ